MNECRYNRFCNFPGEGCLEKDEDTCPEALAIYEKICPLMVATKIPKANCGCDIPRIRELWPMGKKCFQGEECLPRKYEVVQKQVNRITDMTSIAMAFATA